MERRPSQAGCTPAELNFQPGRERPAYCAGETGEQRDPSNGIACLAAPKPDHRRKGRFVQADAHSSAYQQPTDKEQDGTWRPGQTGQSGCEDQVAGQQDGATAVVVDAASGRRAKQCRQNQGGGKGAEYGLDGQAQVAGHGAGKHGGQVIGRSPGQCLGKPQAGNREWASVHPHAAPCDFMAMIIENWISAWSYASVSGSWDITVLCPWA